MQSKWQTEGGGVDDENYWNERKQRKQFFDDNAVSPPPRLLTGGHGGKDDSFANKLRAAGLDDPAESVDTVDWSGNVVNTTNTKSDVPKRPTNPPTLSARGSVNSSKPPAPKSSIFNGVHFRKSSASESDQISISSTGSGQQINSSNTSLSHKRSASDANERSSLPDGLSPTISSDTGSASSIEEVIRRDSKPTLAEIARLHAENKSLQRKVTNLTKSRWSPMPIADTVSRIISGEKYSLEPYKSLKDKVSLLDAVVGYHDGNAILAVVLFLKRTLSKSLFHEELRKRPVASSQYLSFLKLQRNDNVVNEMGNLAKTDDAAMWRFKTASAIESPDGRQKAIYDCYVMCFRGTEGREYEADMVYEYSTLLKKQLTIEPTDARAEQEGRLPFRDSPRKASLYFQPLITSLFYCCLYHYNELETYVSSPLSFKKEFKLTEKQYVFTALRARCSSKAWQDIEALLTAKNWRGKAKMKAPVKFEKIVEVLVSMNAPSDIVDKYLRHVEESDLRLQLAHRYKAHMVIIDTLADLKDRQKLENYRSTVRNTPAENHLEVVLRNPANKWKN